MWDIIYRVLTEYRAQIDVYRIYVWYYVSMYFKTCSSFVHSRLFRSSKLQKCFQLLAIVMWSLLIYVVIQEIFNVAIKIRGIQPRERARKRREREREMCAYVHKSRSAVAEPDKPSNPKSDADINGMRCYYRHMYLPITLRPGCDDALTHSCSGAEEGYAEEEGCINGRRGKRS